ncbi:hypothetical protein V3481_010515 [Fusarium oxysporum f. sp. vasinfectum]|nr:hypothetical protein BKA60DRAFT_581491 [Fusarium oxysporum]
MEQYQQTATGTIRHALQLPDEDPDRTVVDLDLTGENIEFPIKIGELIRRKRHADVYSIYRNNSSTRDMTTEARAFIIDGVAGKLKRHRKRCIQRLGPRTLLNVSCRGAEVIVYTVNCNDWLVTAEEEDKDSNETCRSVLVPTGKTSYKREAARIRQRERRREKADQEHSSSPQDAELITNGTSLSEDLADTFRAAILLYIFFDKKGYGRPFGALYVPGSCRRSSKLVNLYSLLFVNGSPPSKFGDPYQTSNADKWLRHEILQHFKDLETHFSNMSYRQLFTGVHSVLLTLSSSDLRSVPSSNHQFDLIQHIQTTLPILIDNFQYETHGRVSSEPWKALLLS